MKKYKVGALINGKLEEFFVSCDYFDTQDSLTRFYLQIGEEEILGALVENVVWAFLQTEEKENKNKSFMEELEKIKQVGNKKDFPPNWGRVNPLNPPYHLTCRGC